MESEKGDVFMEDSLKSALRLEGKVQGESYKRESMFQSRKLKSENTFRARNFAGALRTIDQSVRDSAEGRSKKVNHANWEDVQTKRHLWNALLLALALYQLVIVPFRLAFYSEVELHRELVAWVFVELVLVDFFTSAEFISRYRTQSRQSGKIFNARPLAMEGGDLVLREKNRTNRITLALCFATFVPWELAVAAGSQLWLGNGFRVWCWLRPVKCLQVVKTRSYVQSALALMNSLNIRIGKASVRCVGIYFGALYTGHLFACLWSVTRNEPSYLNSLYFALTTISTCGFGDITPVGNNQVLLVVFGQAFAVTIYVLVLSALTSLISNRDAARLEQNRKAFFVRMFLLNHGSSDELIQKVHTFMDLLWDRSMGYDDDLLLKQLPACIQANVRFELFSNHLMNEPIFDSCDADCIQELVAGAKICVFLPGERILSKGARADRFFGILAGSISLRVPNGGGDRKLSLTGHVGQLVGHLEVFAGLTYESSACASKSDNFTEVFVLEKEHVMRVLQIFDPYSLEEMQQMAAGKLRDGSWKQKLSYGEGSTKQTSSRRLLGEISASFKQSASDLVKRLSSSSEKDNHGAKKNSRIVPEPTKSGIWQSGKARPEASMSDVSASSNSHADMSRAASTDDPAFQLGTTQFGGGRKATAKSRTRRSSLVLSNVNSRVSGRVAHSSSTKGVDNREEQFSLLGFGWKALGWLGCTYFAFWTPYNLAFLTHRQELYHVDIFLNFAFDVYFWADLAIQVAWGVKEYKAGNLSRRWDMLVFFSPLAVSAVSLLPIDIVLSLVTKNFPLWSFARLLRMLKAMEIFSYIKYVESLTGALLGRLDTALCLALRLLLSILILGFWIVCGWWWYGTQDSCSPLYASLASPFPDSLPPSPSPSHLLVQGNSTTCSWVDMDQTLHFMCRSLHFSGDHSDATLSVEGCQSLQLARSIYYAFTVITTVGYGDVFPVEASERILTVLAICLLSLLLYPALVGNISVLQSVPSDAGVIDNEARNKVPLDVLAVRARASSFVPRLSDHTRQQVKLFLEEIEGVDQSFEELVEILPNWLGKKAAYELFGAFVLSRKENETNTHGSVSLFPQMNALNNEKSLRFNGLFEKVSTDFLSEICYNLRQEFHPPSSVVVYEGEQICNVLFCQKGKLEVLNSTLFEAPKNSVLCLDKNAIPKLPTKPDRASSAVQAIIYPGKYFGVVEAIKGTRSKLALITVEGTILLKLPTKKFLEILDRFPLDAATLKRRLDAENQHSGQTPLSPANKLSMRRPSERFERGITFRTGGATGGDAQKQVRGRSEHSIPWYIILPFSRVSKWLDLLSTYFALQTNVLIPLGIGALTNSACTLESNAWILSFLFANGIADVFSILDMVLHSCSYAVRTETTIIVDRHMIWKLYSRSTKFKIDLLASFPLDWLVLLALGGSTTYLYITNWLRLVKLVRVLQIRVYVMKIEHLLIESMRISSNRMKLIHLLVVLSVFAHWLTCFWLRFANSGEGFGSNEEATSWAEVDCVVNSNCFTTTEVQRLAWNVTMVDTAPVCVRFMLWRTYIRGLYWVFVTLNTVGFGDIVARSTEETVFTISVMFLGAGMYAFLISSLAIVVANLDKTATMHRDAQDQIRLYVAYRRLPQYLRDKIFNYLEYTWREQRGGGPEDVFRFLPSSIQLEALDSITNGQVVKVPLFKGLAPPVICSIVRRLEPGSFSPGDFIFAHGHPSTRIFLLSKGAVCQLAADGVTVVSKHKNSGIFGVEEFYDGSLFNTSLQATSFCDMASLQRSALEEIVLAFDCEEIIKKNAVALKSQSETLKLAGNLKNRKVTKMMADEPVSMGKSGVHPKVKARVFFEAVMFLFHIYVIFSVPYRIAFVARVDTSLLSDTAWTVWVVFDVLLVNCLGAVDMYCHAKLFSYFRDGVLVADRKQILQHYKAQWLKIDILGVLPLDLVALLITALIAPSETFRVWSWCRLPTVLRTKRIATYFVPLIEYHLHELHIPVSATVVRVVCKMFNLFVFLHWIACAWFICALFEGLESSWFVRASIHGKEGSPYLVSLYFTTTTFSTVGYGDLVPLRLSETVFAIMELLMCLFLYADLVANVTNLIQQSDSSSYRQETLHRAIRRLVKNRALSESLNAQIEEFLESDSLLARFGFREQQILQMLPASIQGEISSHMHWEVLSRVPGFLGAPRPCIIELTRKFRNRCLVSGDTICVKDSLVLELCMLHRGKLFYLLERTSASHEENDANKTSHDAASSRLIPRGELVGWESILGLKAKRTVVSVGVSDVYVLSKKDLDQVLEHFPCVQTDVRSAATKAVESLEARTDFPH